MPAPGLRETADIWWDSGADPEVLFDAPAGRFLLVDGAAGSSAALILWQPGEPVAEPERVARALAEGLAACDFPPTGDGAHPDHVTAALRAAGLLA